MNVFRRFLEPLALDPDEERYPIDLFSKTLEQELEVYAYNLYISSHFEVYDAHEKVLAQSFIEDQKKYWSYKNGITAAYSGYFCPIYFIVVEDEIDRIVYVGQTNSNSNRFHDGHKATQYLNHHEFDGKKKHIYFAQIQISYEHLIYQKSNNFKYTNYIPIEFLKYNSTHITNREYYDKIKTLTKAQEESPIIVRDIINFIESILIFMKQPIINSALKENEKKNFHNPEVKLTKTGGFTVIHSDRIRESPTLLGLNQDFKNKYSAWLNEESKWITI